jgi:hypothetical protein
LRGDTEIPTVRIPLISEAVTDGIAIGDPLGPVLSGDWESELVRHREGVPGFPVLADLAVGELTDPRRGEGQDRVGRRSPHLGLCGVCSGEPPSDDDQVLLSDEMFDQDPAVGEGSLEAIRGCVERCSIERNVV